MNFLKKVFDDKIDDSVHLQFQKFSKGEFRNKAMIKAKNSSGKTTILTSAEFTNDFVRIMAEKLGLGKARVTGIVVSTADLSGKLDFKDKNQFQGVKKYMIDKEMSGSEIIEILNQFPKSFFALSFGVGDNELKIKAKAPKSAKPSSKGKEKPKPDFCKLVTSDSEMAKSFVFEKPDFKEANISHNFIINELILPKGETDYAKLRELAKRKGKIIREAEIDGQIIKSEKEFVA